MFLSVVFVLSGLVLLYFGGEGLVRGAVSIAHRMKISMLLVSTVIVGFGTSMPEMIVSIQAALDGAPDISLGNVVGSNIANILLILGLCALIVPIVGAGHSVIRDVWVVMGSALMLALACLVFPSGGLILGLVFLAVLAAYLTWSYRQDKKNDTSRLPEAEAKVEHFEEDVDASPPLKTPRAVLYTLGGMGVLALGAKLLVMGSVDIARTFGLSEAVIGLTLVAVGTSLPELATGVVAALKRHSDVILGNVLGSCVFNVLAILGVTMLVADIPFTSRIADFDAWIMLAVTVILLPVVLTGRVISRREGAMFLAIYIAYTIWLLFGGR